MSLKKAKKEYLKMAVRGGTEKMEKAMAPKSKTDYPALFGTLKKKYGTLDPKMGNGPLMRTPKKVNLGT